ncbi:phosphorylase [Stakelama sediminis]|uniref:Nucleoside phosphorylase domain-containing protein n=1 Tax=Stakelama sediminis TaxID=463200 RepID=A0A840Z1K5_9SPHN|nr:hypothetical protein [Stakelama sediminis]
MTLIVACGLLREKRLIEGTGRDIVAVAGGGDGARLAQELHALAVQSPGPIVSSGLAGALNPTLHPGDVIIDGNRRLIEKLLTMLPYARRGGVIGRDDAVAAREDKRILWQESGAIAVDMESHVAALVAEERGLPFAAVRVISDTADETLPPAALAGMRPDGGMALGRVLASLARHPAQLPALIRTGRRAGTAFKRLGGVYDVLGRLGIGRLDLGEFPLDMG